MCGFDNNNMPALLAFFFVIIIIIIIIMFGDAIHSSRGKTFCLLNVSGPLLGSSSGENDKTAVPQMYISMSRRNSQDSHQQLSANWREV